MGCKVEFGVGFGPSVVGCAGGGLLKEPTPWVFLELGHQRGLREAI